ncbi:hypothetical protein Tco_0632731 [Tanacetum coccineum]
MKVVQSFLVNFLFLVKRRIRNIKTHGSRIQEEVFGVNSRLLTRRQSRGENVKNCRGQQGFLVANRLEFHYFWFVMDVLISAANVPCCCQFNQYTARLKMKILLLALVSAARVVLSQLLLLASKMARFEFIEDVITEMIVYDLFDDEVELLRLDISSKDEAVHKELGDSLVRAATTASSLEAEQDSGNITKTQSKATPNESSSLGTTSGGGPRCQETMRDTISQTRFENVSKHSNDSLLARGNTLQSDEDRLKLDELMALCTTLQNRVLDLEKTKTTQANEIASLKRRVKKLEKKNRSRTHRLKRLYKVGLTARVESSRDEESLGEDASKQGRINAIDADEEITLVSVQDDADKEMFDVDALNGEEVFVAGKNENVVEEVVDAAQVSTAATTVTITTEEITLAQALEALKTSKPKVKGIVFQEPGKSTTTTTISSQQSQDKGKGIMIEEPVKPMKKKVQIMLDEEVALKLQAEFDEEERLAREKAKKEKEANIALIEEWDDIQEKIDADYQLAKRLQAEDQEELSIENNSWSKEESTLLLKNMEGKKPKELKNKSFDSIQKMFDRAFKRVNTFVDFKTDLVKGSSKRAGEELEQESTKKQKVDKDKDTAELQSLMKVIPDEEEVAIDVVPLATKSPKIVDWKIYKEGKKSYYQIVRANGKSQMYMIFSQMLKSFDREDLEDLYKLVKARYGSIRPVESMDYLLWSDMKIMFKPYVEDEVWKLQQGYKVLA